MDKTLTDFSMPTPQQPAAPAAPAGADNFDPMSYVAVPTNPNPGYNPQPAPTSLYQDLQSAGEPSPQFRSANDVPQREYGGNNYNAPSAPPGWAYVNGQWVQVQEPQQRVPERLFDTSAPVNYGLSADEQTRYQASLPVIEKIVNARMAAAEEALRNRFGQLDGRFAEYSSDVETAFASAVQASIPDLGQITSDASWGAYLNQRVPGTGATTRDLVEAAYNRRDMMALRELTDGFRARAGGMRSNTPSTIPTFNAHSNAPVASQVPLQRLPISGLNNAARDFTRGQITRANYDAVRALYDAAANEQRIDMNA